MGVDTSLRIKFKKVCETCPHRDIYTEENTMYTYDVPYMKFTTIGCKHEKICKMYLEDDSPTIR